MNKRRPYGRGEMPGCKNGKKAVRYGMGKGVQMRIVHQHGVDVDIEVILYSILITPVFHGSEINVFFVNLRSPCPIGTISGFDFPIGN